MHHIIVVAPPAPATPASNQQVLERTKRAKVREGSINTKGMATATAFRPSTVSVNSASEHQQVAVEEEHASSTSTSSANAVTPQIPDHVPGIIDGGQATNNDDIPEHQPIDQPLMMNQPQHQSATRLLVDPPASTSALSDNHHNRNQEEEHDLGLSLSSPTHSPRSSSNYLISNMARQVSGEALNAAVTAAAATASSSQTQSSTTATTGEDGDVIVIVDATLLPKPRTTTQQQQQQHHTQDSSHVDSLLPQTSTVADGVGDASSDQLLEARIMQLEQSLNTVTQLCQSLLLQQQQQQMGGNRSRMHSREGSEATALYGDSPPGTPNTNSVNHDESDPHLLSQWPPSNQHHLLESPDVSMRAQRVHLSRNRSSRPRRTSSASSIGSAKRTGLGSKGKTMSMVLLDINPGENRGPSMIPFTSDLDACDEMDGDSVAGGCRDRKGMGSSSGDVTRRGSSSSRNNSPRGSDGSESNSIDGSSRTDGIEKKRQPSSSSIGTDEGANSSSNESSSTSSSSHRRTEKRGSRGQRRLSSSMKEGPSGNNLECQAFTDTHLEALRLRREAGKGRAHSFNGSLLQGETRNNDETEASWKQWKPTLDILDGSVTGSIVSTNTAESYVENAPSTNESKEGLDIIIPDLSLQDPRSHGNDGTAAAPMSVVTSSIVTKTVGTNTTLNTPINNIAHSTSCASNMSSQTLKAGNTNEQVSSARKNKIRSASVASSSSGNTTKERSQSISSNKSGNSSTPAKEGISSDAITPKKANNTKPKSSSKKGKSPHKHSSPSEQSSSTTVAVKDNGKNNQTMKEYVINDLLNIDSRNHDGSATEDIDANMEEFLRIPSKLENLIIFSLAVCLDSFLYAWAMLPLKFVWGWICLLCSALSPRKGVRGIKFHRRHLYPMMQSVLIFFVYSQVLCPISIGKLYHWIRGQAMLKLYVLIAIVEVFDRLLCSFGQDAWDSLYWNTTRRPWHRRMFVSIIVVGVYVTIHSLFLFVHVATLSVAVNSADNALLTLLISGNFAEIKSTVFKKYNKQNLFKITTSDICERFKLALFLLLILFLNQFQGEMTTSMVKDYYSMCGMVFAAEYISDWIKHSFITKFNLIKSTIYFDYALVISGDVTGIGHEGLNLDYTHAAMKRLGLAQIPLVCVTARYLHEAVRFAIADVDVDHPVAALIDLMADGNKWKFYTGLLQGMAALVLFKIALGMCIRYVARGYLGGNSITVSKGASRKSSLGTKSTKENDTKKKQ